MRKKLFVFIIAAAFLLTQVSAVYAKGTSAGRASSSASHSVSRSSGGYSGSSSSKSSAGSSSSSSKSSVGSSSSSSKSSVGSSSSSSSSSSSKSGYSGSSSSSSGSSGSSSASSGSSGSRTTPFGSSSGSSKSTSASSSAASSKTSTQKSAYMQDQYKQELSKKNYTTYKQDLNDEQKKVYESSFNSSYRVNNRMGFEDAMRTRDYRASTFSSRPINININTNRFGGSFWYGSAFAGPWDLWFLMRASDLFWYHHWMDIYPYRDYFDAGSFADMERRVRALEQQNIARDPGYLDPDVDPDLQFSNDYMQSNMDKVYYTNKYPARVQNPFTAIITIIIIIAVLIVFIRLVSKPRPRKSFNSRIY